MADGIANVLVSTFTGLNLPRTVLITVSRSTSIHKLRSAILSHLPSLDVPFIITTHSRKELLAYSSEPTSSLLTHDHGDLISLRLTVPLRGGKGGFGSQLRAAGGRMASRKKRNQGEANGSSRNLDGRRLRTVTEAKALAEYLAIKPDMDQKQKEARHRKWETIVQAAEEREEKIRQGIKGKLDGQWVDDKDEATERTREAVLKAMRSHDPLENRPVLQQGLAGTESEPEGEDSAEAVQSRYETRDGLSIPTLTHRDSSESSTQSRPRLFGFDNEDDEFLSEDGSGGE